MIKEDEDFLTEFKTRCATDEHTAIDFMFDHVDELLLERKFDRVDQIIGTFHGRNFSILICVALLTITNPKKRYLTTRDKFIEACQVRTDTGLTPKQREHVLDGFHSKEK